MAEPFTLWTTGLSAAGKSTLCSSVSEELKLRGVPVAWLDGDEIRTELSRGLGFSHPDRVENARRVAYVARTLNRSGVSVLVSLISPYREMRTAAREIIPVFLETYVRVSLERAEARDPKGLYAKALRGEIPAFTGISDPYEEPEHPDLVVDTEVLDEAAATRFVMTHLEREGFVPRSGSRRVSLTLDGTTFVQLARAAENAGLESPADLLKLVATETAEQMASTGEADLARAAEEGTEGSEEDDAVILKRLRDLGYID